VDPDRKTHKVYVQESYTISIVEAVAQAQTGIPRCMQLLYYGSPECQLDDESATLSDCGVELGSKLRMAPRFPNRCVSCQVF
jgi:hypothetical protein